MGQTIASANSVNKNTTDNIYFTLFVYIRSYCWKVCYTFSYGTFLEIFSKWCTLVDSYFW